MDGKPSNPLRQNILEAVDCLRLRKCRPDRESIAHYVLRKFGSTMNEIFAELENIVDEGGLIKVEYKGTTSYRSPSSFDTKNSPLLTKHSKILNSSKTTRFIITGINELLVKDPNYSKEGVPLDELKETLVGFDSLRFGEDKLDVLLERETNCGGIFIAKSDILTDSFRVFPKDIPVPSDMRIVSLSSDNLLVEKEEKKPRKPRKSNLVDVKKEQVPGTSSGVKRGRKPKVKKEEEDTEEEIHEESGSVFAVKSEPTLSESETGDLSEDAPLKKNARLTPMGRKLVAEKLAEAVRKTYENNSEFETTSAQMIKLASALVNKQSDEVVKNSTTTGPVLVLAESVVDSSSQDNNGDLSDSISIPVVNSEKMESDDNSKSNNKKRGRPSSSSNKGVTKEINSDSDSHKEEEKPKAVEISPTPAELGLTRSKRDKRKKQVFDPSDLPKSSYASYSRSSNRRTRSPSPEEPPAKKVAAPKKGKGKSQPPAVPLENKRANSAGSKKSTPDSTPTKKVNSPSKEKAVAVKSVVEEDMKVEESTKEIENGTVQKAETASTTETEETTDSPVKRTNLCEYCLQNSKANSNGENEEFLTCASCNANIHPSCMDYPMELTMRIQEFNKMDGERKLPWQCFDCKICSVCQQRMMPPSEPVRNGGSKIVVKAESPSKQNTKEQRSNSLQFVLCEYCDSGFHAKCTGEQFPKYAPRKEAWMCLSCKDFLGHQTLLPIKSEVPEVDPKNSTKGGKVVKKGGRVQRKQSNASLSESQLKDEIPPTESVDTNTSVVNQVAPSNEISSSTEDVDIKIDTSDEPTEEKEDTTVDIRSWTPIEVEAYFIEKGLKDEAAILREQEVDGYSLLLLQREDIVNGMGFRLGPALKVNRLIAELQEKAPIKAKWNHEPITPTPEVSDTTSPSVSQQ